jgi:hypothetical protein
MVCGVHTPWDFAPNAYLLPMYLFVSTIMVVHSGPRRLFGIADWMRGSLARALPEFFLSEWLLHGSGPE